MKKEVMKMKRLLTKLIRKYDIGESCTGSCWVGGC